eukprot:scaffold161696_cov70-Cyclotella_meneghiniana.AAC.1
MTSQNGLTTATTISPNFVNIQLQRKPQEVKKASFTPAIDCKSHYDDWQIPIPILSEERIEAELSSITYIIESLILGAVAYALGEQHAGQHPG